MTLTDISILVKVKQLIHSVGQNFNYEI